MRTVRNKQTEDWGYRGGIGAMVLVGLVIGLLVLVAEGWANYSARQFDGKTRFTRLVVADSQVELWSFDPADDQLIKLTLPPDMEVVTVGRGRWMTSSLPELGRKFGREWFIASVSSFLGVPITSVAESESFWDTVMWQWYSRGKSVRQVKLVETNWVMPRLAMDGQQVFDLGQAWQAKASELFYSSAIASAGWKLAVYNPTGVPGLGAKLARLAETQGFKVVVLAQGSEKSENCIVSSNPDMKTSVGVGWLTGYFDCDWQEDLDLGPDEAELIVGDRFADWMN